MYQRQHLFYLIYRGKSNAKLQNQELNEWTIFLDGWRLIKNDEQRIP